MDITLQICDMFVLVVGQVAATCQVGRLTLGPANTAALRALHCRGATIIVALLGAPQLYL